MTEDILQIQAAHALKPGWDNYKPTAKAALRDESTQIQQWLVYVAANADQQRKAVVISDERRAADRKADKAGGLYLALAGTLVRPDGGVDDSREYELTAADGIQSK